MTEAASISPSRAPRSASPSTASGIRTRCRASPGSVLIHSIPRFTEQVFDGLLDAAGRAQIKGILRDQSVIAGIGNAYSDEVLHAAKLSPFKPAANLSAEERKRLYAAIADTLSSAVERSHGLAAGKLKAEKKIGMRVHARAGLPCPVCGDTVREVSFSDSSLQYCPTCQTGGQLLADRRLSRLLK